MKENKIIYTIQEVIRETSDVVTLKMTCTEGLPTYCAGQFMTVYFADLGNAEGKAYTISSEPSEETLNITVKGIGQFSNKLCGLVVGDIVTASLPYGYFYSESSTSPLIMIAGGIGVTPFRSMITDSVKKYPARPLILFYSNKNFDDIVFRNELEMLQTSTPSLTIKNYITQRDEAPSGTRKGRIAVSDVLDEAKKFNDPEFFLCGSISFVRDFWKGLKDSGISEDKIYTEAFF